MVPPSLCSDNPTRIAWLESLRDALLVRLSEADGRPRSAVLSGWPFRSSGCSARAFGVSSDFTPCQRGTAAPEIDQPRLS